MSGLLVSLRKTILYKPNYYCFAVFAVFTLISISGLISGIRLFAVLLLLATFFIWLRIQNLFVSFFLVTIFSLTLFTPHKYYLIEVIPASELTDTIYYDEGYSVGYGVNLSNIFLALTILVVIREFFKNRLLLEFFNSIILANLGVSFLIFFILSYYSAIFSSPFPNLSVVWLLQYSAYFFISILVLFYYQNYRPHFSLLFSSLLGSLWLQIVVGFWQFAKQSFVGLSIESGSGTSFAMGLDEVNAIFRIAGTFLFHNQLALITLVLTCLCLPYCLRKKEIFGLFTVLASLVVIIFTQSRSIWIATFIFGLIIFRKYQNPILRMVRKIGVRRVLFYSSLLAILLSNVILPRVLMSANFGYEGAGLPVRLRMINEGWDAFIQNPWLGYGVGSTEYTIHRLSPKGVSQAFPNAIHFAPLQLLLEVGILGAVAFLWPFLIVFRRIVNKQAFGDFSFSYLAGLGAFLSNYLTQPHFGILEFAYLGLILGFGLISLYDGNR